MGIITGEQAHIILKEIDKCNATNPNLTMRAFYFVEDVIMKIANAPDPLEDEGSKVWFIHEREDDVKIKDGSYADQVDWFQRIDAKVKSVEERLEKLEAKVRIGHLVENMAKWDGYK